MKVIVQGQGEVNLGQNDFVGAGGEGQIFAKGLTAYKVYFDAKRMLPVGKITELSAIRDPNVIKPQGVLLDPKGNNPVGYTMRYLTGTMPLCQIFTRAFRDREGLDHPKMASLVLGLREVVHNVHGSGILIVDLNEMNFLVDKGFKHVYAIDVDSYQTRSYPATAIMPSVKDWSVHNNAFTEGSDWFSFACVAYQMFTGIHPYKGKHPTIHGLDERMQKNVSVFDPTVSVPKVVYPMDVIPPAYRAWFKAVLQDGKRVPPPTDLTGAIILALPTRTVATGDALDIQELFRLATDVQGYIDNAGVSVVWSTNAVMLGTRTAIGSGLPIRAVGFSPKMSHAVAAWEQDGSLMLRNLTTGDTMDSTMQVSALMGYNGRIYGQSGDSIVEVILTDVGGRVIASPRIVANILPHATKMWDGCATQNLLGSTYVSMFPSSGEHHQLRVPELDSYRIVDAKYDNRILMVIGSKGGHYDRFVVEINDTFSGYALRPLVPDITPSGLNFVVLDNGVCVHLTEDEKLEITARGSSKVKVIDAPVLGNDMRLIKHAGKVGFVRGNTVSSMRMK
jgi:serine/threonine protein kinase